jgi:predicted RNA methylase
MKKENLERIVNDLSDSDGWNHYYEFPYNIKTRSVHIQSPGYCIHKWPRLEAILSKESLEKKTLVDVGCSDGYFSINAARMGLKVKGFDLDPLRIKRAELAKEVLSQENVDFECRDVFKIEGLQKFDYCFGLGLLHRVSDIVGCLKNLSKLSDFLILEYKTYNSVSDMCFEGKKGEVKVNAFNTLHGIPTNTFVKNRLEELGFNEIEFDLDTKSNLNFKRSICIAKR